MIDRAFCCYADEQFLEGTGPAAGERLLSAWCSLFAEYNAGDFPFFLRALRGWRRLRPKASRHPLPWPVLCAAAYHVLTRSDGGFSAFVCLLVMFDCYLRPYEALRMRVIDAVPPCALSPFWVIIVCPQDALRPSKTRIFDDSISLDTPGREIVAHALAQLVSQRRAAGSNALLFDFTHQQLGAWFAAALDWLGLRPWQFTLYACRHGGASEDFGRSLRPLDAIQRRGRWACLQSVRRYQQHGRLHVVYARTPAPIIQHCLAAAAHLPELLAAPRLLRQPVGAAFDVPLAAPFNDDDD